MTETEAVPVQNGMDLLLVLLHSGGARKGENEEIVGNTRLDKLMYLLEKETSLKKYLANGFHFDAYNFGPYSSELFDAIQALANAGLVSIERSESQEYLTEVDRYQIEAQLEDTPGNTSALIYGLTEDGKKVAEALAKSLSNSEINELNTIKKTFNSISLKGLLRYVYKKYPESAVNSLIKDQVC